MGINVRVKNTPKPDDVMAVQMNLEKDLKSCMHCKFFYGNNSQCIKSDCVKKDSKHGIMEQNRENKCFGCPYRQSEQYCFPCMKKLLDKKENTFRASLSVQKAGEAQRKETERIVLEQEEKDG